MKVKLGSLVLMKEYRVLRERKFRIKNREETGG
jgi:hypothetical protein